MMRNSDGQRSASSKFKIYCRWLPSWLQVTGHKIVKHMNLDANRSVTANGSERIPLEEFLLKFNLIQLYYRTKWNFHSVIEKLLCVVIEFQIISIKNLWKKVVKENTSITEWSDITF